MGYSKLVVVVSVLVPFFAHGTSKGTVLLGVFAQKKRWQHTSL